MPDTPGRSGETEELAAALYAALGLSARRLRHSPSPGDLSPPERSVLARLDRDGPSTAAALARGEQITPQALGTTTAALERHGLVGRRRDPDDGRRVLLSATDAGRDVLRRKRDARARRLADVLDERFDADERATLAAATPLLERLGEWI